MALRDTITSDILPVFAVFEILPEQSSYLSRGGCRGGKNDFHSGSQIPCVLELVAVPLDNIEFFAPEF